MGFRRDVHALVAHADAVLIPSRHEGLPYVLLEAMMLGVPVVASRIGGLAEVLRDGETGLLVPVGSPEALCRAVASLLDDADLRRQLAGAASRLWQRQYTLQAMGAAYIGVYQAALASSRARR
jgi:glycosyltransferase involved in cell wall biosynthesis